MPRKLADASLHILRTVERGEKIGVNSPRAAALIRSGYITSASPRILTDKGRAALGLTVHHPETWGGSEGAW